MNETNKHNLTTHLPTSEGGVARTPKTQETLELLEGEGPEP